MRYSEQDLIARHSCASIRQSEYAEQYCKTGMKNTPQEGRMTRHIQTVAAGVFALCSALIPGTGLTQEVTLRVHSFLPPVANPMKHYVTPWAQKVEKEPGGRIKVQVFPSMQLGGKAEQLLTQVRDGVVDVAWTLPGFTPGVMPKLDIFELPFLHRNTNATVRSLQEYVPKYMKKEFEPYHVLLVHCHAGA